MVVSHFVIFLIFSFLSTYSVEGVRVKTSKSQYDIEEEFLVEIRGFNEKNEIVPSKLANYPLLNPEKCRFICELLTRRVLSHPDKYMDAKIVTRDVYMAYDHSLMNGKQFIRTTLLMCPHDTKLHLYVRESEDPAMRATEPDDIKAFYILQWNEEKGNIYFIYEMTIDDSLRDFNNAGTSANKGKNDASRDSSDSEEYNLRRKLKKQKSVKDLY